eukprot:ANDGO_03062.mRNA.1 hypothetical protein
MADYEDDFEKSDTVASPAPQPQPAASDQRSASSMSNGNGNAKPNGSDDVAKLRAQNVELRKELVSLNRQLDAALAQSGQPVRSRPDTSAEANARQIKSLQKQVDALRKENEDLKKMLGAQATERVTALENMLHEARKSNSELSAEVKSLKAIQREQSKALQSYDAGGGDVVKQLHDSQEDLKVLREKLKKAHAKLAEDDRGRKADAEKNAKLQDKNQKLMALLQNKNINPDTQEDADALRKQLAEESERRVKAEEAAMNARKSAETDRKRVASLQHQLKLQQEESESEISKLNEQLREKEKEARIASAAVPARSSSTGTNARNNRSQKLAPVNNNESASGDSNAAAGGSSSTSSSTTEKQKEPKRSPAPKSAPPPKAAPAKKEDEGSTSPKTTTKSSSSSTSAKTSPKTSPKEPKQEPAAPAPAPAPAPTSSDKPADTSSAGYEDDFEDAGEAKAQPAASAATDASANSQPAPASGDGAAAAQDPDAGFWSEDGKEANGNDAGSKPGSASGSRKKKEKKQLPPPAA